MDNSLYFSEAEFRCPHCGLCRVSPVLLEALDWIRKMVRRPVYITSGCRCPEYSIILRHRGYKSVDGSVHEVHPDGHDVCEAADISCRGSANRRTLLILAHEKFTRVGIAKTFVHVDCDKSKPQNVTWVY